MFGALANYDFRPIDWPESANDRVYAPTQNQIYRRDNRVTEVIENPMTGEAVFVIVSL